MRKQRDTLEVMNITLRILKSCVGYQVRLRVQLGLTKDYLKPVLHDVLWYSAKCTLEDMAGAAWIP